jgi:hypothetical protein
MKNMQIKHKSFRKDILWFKLYERTKTRHSFKSNDSIFEQI